MWVEDSRRDGLEIVKKAQLRVGRGLNHAEAVTQREIRMEEGY